MATVTTLVPREAEAKHANVTPREREAAGWRSGRPIEDPDKTKRWGFIAAKPSEFLVHVRGGKVLDRSSGQGTTCFKWPWDSVAVVPTSLQQLRFRADQVTIERVGVEVTGIAVFRIAEPLLAYRVLNFSYPERAQEKLEQTLSEMFVGAARRLIANLTVDECLQKRKAALAVELLREIAPVVGGSGRADDWTEKGWGVVIDTIEIQEVRVMSSSVFAAMQAPFRAALEQRAHEAKSDAQRQVSLREADAQREVALREAACKRAIEEARIASEAELEEARIATEAELEERRSRTQLAATELRTQTLRAQIALDKEQAEAARARRHAELELVRAEGAVNAEIALANAKAEQVVADARAKQQLAEKLPELAAALGQRIGDVRITQVGGDGNPFAQLTQGVSAVIALAKDAIR